MGMILVPPGGRGHAHLHAAHETAIYVLSGEGEMWYGEGLRAHTTVRAGDFMYIPTGMPHVPANTSETEPLIGIAARTDPNEQESVILRPDLDGCIPRSEKEGRGRSRHERPQVFEQAFIICLLTNGHFVRTLSISVQFSAAFGVVSL